MEQVYCRGFHTEAATAFVHASFDTQWRRRRHHPFVSTCFTDGWHLAGTCCRQQGSGVGGASGIRPKHTHTHTHTHVTGLSNDLARSIA